MVAQEVEIRFRGFKIYPRIRKIVYYLDEMRDDPVIALGYLMSH